MGEETILEEQEGTMTLPDPGYYQYYRNLDSRRIIINSKCDENLIADANMILLWNEEDFGKPIEERTPIKIMINTNGGDVSAAMHLVDIISVSKTPVYTIGLGLVYSAGALIFIAGHKRMIFKNTTMLIHDGMIAVGESAGKFCDAAKFLEEQNKRINKFITSRTKISEEEINQKYRYDWFMFEDEIIEKGCADEIITDIDEVL